MTAIRGKRVLITGAASGMGLGMARRFAAEGAETVLVDLEGDALRRAEDTLRHAGHSAVAFACDLSRFDEIAELRRQVTVRAGPIDILVNNAGVVTGGRYDRISADDDQRMLAVNAAAVHWMTKAFLPDLQQSRGGHLVQMASAAGLMGVPEQVVYCATKWFVIGLTEALMAEQGESGYERLNFTIVCPGFVDTGMFEGVRSPRLMPMLRSEDVVDAVITAVKENRLYVLEPSLVKLTPALHALLPRGAFDRVAKLLGVYASMRSWQGRSQESRFDDDDFGPHSFTGEGATGR